MSTTVTSPTTTPTITPVQPEVQPWPERFTDPYKICPQQKRELTSPDVAP